MSCTLFINRALARRGVIKPETYGATVIDQRTVIERGALQYIKNDASIMSVAKTSSRCAIVNFVPLFLDRPMNK